MKVDIHNHILPREWPNLKERYGYGGFIQLKHRDDGLADMMKDENVSVFTPTLSDFKIS